MVIWLSDSTGRLGVEDGIVRAEEVQELLALQDCRRVLAEQQEHLLDMARQQAQAVMAQAHQEATALLEASRMEAERAVHRGYEEGHHKAVLEWQARQIGHTIDKGQALRAMHQKLASIVTAAVERIVHTESREALYQRALDSVHGLTRGATSLTLRVHPEDHDDARSALAAMPEPPHGVSMQVTADASLQPGSCVFESDLGVLDASLHTQLNGLRSAMDRVVRSAVAEMGDDVSLSSEHGEFEQDHEQEQEEHADDEDGYGHEEQDSGEYTDEYLDASDETYEEASHG